MARRGALPVVHSFACFLSARPNEQIYNQCSERSKVIYVGSLAGLLPGGPGHSHQSVRDISRARRRAEPGDGRAVRSKPRCRRCSTTSSNGASESAYLRLVSVKWPMPFDYPAGQRVEPGTGWIVRDGARRRGRSATARGCWRTPGTRRRSSSGRPASTTRLVNLPWLNRVDPGWLREAIGDAARVVTLDNHYVHGGQGEMLAAAVAELGLDPAVRVTRIGVTELPECGTNDEVLAYHRLDVAVAGEDVSRRAGSRVARRCRRA